MTFFVEMGQGPFDRKAPFFEEVLDLTQKFQVFFGVHPVPFAVLFGL